MEFEIKDLDRILETVDKIHDTFVGIHDELIYLNQRMVDLSDGHSYDRERVCRALESIAQELVVENEAL